MKFKLLLLLSLFTTVGLISMKAQASNGFGQIAAIGNSDQIKIKSAYPNPFYHTTTFSFQVKQSQKVTVEVLNLLGKRVLLLHKGFMESGIPYNYTINVNQLDGGKLFFYRITGENFRIVRKITIYQRTSKETPLKPLA